MNKKVFSRCGAALASVAFLASSLAGGASAASKYDLAKHVDEFDMQTLGYKVVATSDGGYIVGGKTITCLAYDANKISKEKESAPSVEEDGYKFVDYEECAKHQNAEGETTPTAEKEYELPNIYDYCNSHSIILDGPIEDTIGDAISYAAQEATEGTSANAAADEDSDEGAGEIEEPALTYSLECMDYMAKYDKNGKGLWMTPVEDASNIIAVGETNSDYRMLTDYGYIYMFEKADGADDRIGYDGVAFSAKFNADGSLVSMNNEGIHLYSKNGNYVRSFELDHDAYEYTNVIVNNNGILVSRTDDEKGEVLSISDDLKTTKNRMTTQNGEPIAMSINNNGDIIIARVAIDLETGKVREVLFESFDKDDKKLGQLSYGEDDKIEFMFVNNFVATNKISLIKNSLVGGFGADEENDAEFIAMYSRDLKETARATVSEDEIINDVTILKNGTLVTAGGVVNSDSNNGLRIHLAAATSEVKPASNVKNPETGDGIQFAGMIGGIAALGAVVLLGKKFARR